MSSNKKIDVLFNSPRVEQIKIINKQEAKDFSHNKLVLCHEGSLPFDRGLKEMVEVVDRLRSNVDLYIIGDVFVKTKEWLELEIEKRQLSDNIFRTGWLPYNSIFSHFSKCDVGLILFRECLMNIMSGFSQ